MSNPQDTQQTQADRTTIREAISSNFDREQQQRAAKLQRERRGARDARAKKRKEARTQKGKDASKKRQASLVQSQAKVQSNVSAASQALQRALRAAQETTIHRHSPEGREQLRLVRSLSAALGALRGVGRGTYYQVDTDFANDVES